MKTNLAELLKGCPRGMELDCTVYDNCTLETVFEGCLYPIQIQTPEGLINLTKYGSMSQSTHSKCVIFPKGKTTWEGYITLYQFKDGDIISVITHNTHWCGIYQKESNTILYSYASYSFDTQTLYTSNNGLCNIKDIIEISIATEEEKQKLFDIIKANGYRWNSEIKTLEKLVEPKFKVGNRIKSKEPKPIINIITQVYENYYELDDGGVLPLNYQDNWELVPNKFDITTLKAFESRVLVRDYINQVWIPTFWGKRLEDDSNCCYLTTNGCYKYCIPYEGNQHLLGTTNDCDDFYKTREK